MSEVETKKLTLPEVLNIYQKCSHTPDSECDICPLYDRMHIGDDWICNLLYRIEKRSERGWERPLIKVTQ